MCHGFSNFQVMPPPLAVLAFLGLVFLEVAGASATVFGLLTSRRRLAGVASFLAGGAAVAYLAALLGLSLLSRQRTLAPGEEKYFCEVDCHLAYSVVGIETGKSIGSRSARGLYRIVTLRVRFDENTIAPWRPRDQPLTPNPRLVRVIDARGRTYPPDPAGQSALESSAGPHPPLTRSLVPGESYVTRLVFDLPPDVADARLLLTEADWPTRLLLGHENSFFHGKVLFRLASPSPLGKGPG